MAVDLNNKTYVFLSLYHPGYSRTGTTYSFLSKNFTNVLFKQINFKHSIHDLVELRRKLKGHEIKLIVSSPSQLLVFPTCLVFRQRPVLDAGWSLFESTITSKSRSGKFYQSALKNYLIDFFASHLSSKIILESILQKKWYSKVYLLPENKCFVNYTGVDEIAMSNIHDKIERLKPITNPKVFRVMFRGKENPESGLEVLASCTHLLYNEEIEFLIISPGLGNRYLFSTKTQVVREKVESKQELANLMKLGNLSLGQLSSHRRTKRTIPHKAFESAFLGIPYLSARSSGVLEIFTEGKDIACFQPGSSEDLARAILEIRDSKELLLMLKRGIQTTYNSTLSQEKISLNLIKIIDN